MPSTLIARGFFKRNAEYVAVRHIRLTKDVVIEPGTVLDGSIYKIRSFQLRHLWNKRSIGVVGSRWANAMLESVDKPRASPETSLSAIKPKQEAPKKKEPKKEALKEEIPSDEASVNLPENVEIDGPVNGWFTIKIDGEEVKKLRGEEQVKNWLKDNGHGPKN